MLAYSSIAHAGYMFLQCQSCQAKAFMRSWFIFLMYLFMNLGAFFVVITVKKRTNGETFDD
ncbi:hypothetical protein Ct9H90mP29_09710 [bacterium]|nr:MAG: hypothetical protein Ct9H90mP29_09710 [bacterium]